MRLTKKVFTDLGIYMIGFGLVIGIVFPFFMLLLGIPAASVMTIEFFLSCIAAGILVGAFNIFLARTVAGRRMKALASKMHFITDKLNTAAALSDLKDCSEESCRLPEDSEDELGETARSFNSLIHALASSVTLEAAVRSFNAMLSTQMELAGLTKRALEQIISYFHASAGALLIERGGELELVSSYRIQDPQSLVSHEAMWQDIEFFGRKHIKLPENVRIDGTLVDFRPAEIIIEPILYRDVPIGILLLAGSKPFEDELIRSLDMFSQSLALAMKNAVTYDQLQKLAANDPLTGIYNRRFGMTRLNEEFNRSVRTGLPIGVIMLDLDHFKKVNDTYGHTVGDRVLINIVKIAAMAVRKGDFSIRYGGEEFLLVLPGASSSDTRFIAERFRHMVEESSVDLSDRKIQVTVSIGAVSYPEYEGKDEYELIKKADTYLYIAKERGRNQVVME